MSASGRGAPSADRREAELVRQLFGAIAPRYDIANRLLSFGLDRWWREKAAGIVAGWKPDGVLDVATGSGDLALAIRRRLPGARVVGADFSGPMLDVARSKGLAETVVADALALPFRDGEFDVATVAFGLRNMESWIDGLREMRRVLSPGGHLLVMDFSLPPTRIMRAFYRVYLHRILPVLAGLLTGHPRAYAYLGRSIENFPSGESMLEMFRAAGFSRPTVTPLTAGIVSIYTGGR